jgi:hypothetical protein
MVTMMDLMKVGRSDLMNKGWNFVVRSPFSVSVNDWRLERLLKNIWIFYLFFEITDVGERIADNAYPLMNKGWKAVSVVRYACPWKAGDDREQGRFSWAWFVL